MNLKKKLLASTATIALGAMVTVGGTFAYFSSEVATESQFTNGTIKLSPNSPYLQNFNISGWKPGDRLVANVTNQDPAMVLNNQGTLPMNVFMDIDASSVKGSVNSILVKELKFGNDDLLAKFYPDGVPDRVTLADITALTNNVNTELNGNTITDVGKYIGFLNKQGTSGAIQTVRYVLEFEDTGSKQNELQGDLTKVGFKFTGLQYEGVEYNANNLDNGNAGGGGEYTPSGYDVNNRAANDDKTN
ncbi:MAG: CalY family protein [Bacillaceae bacterium]|nr:CalY family protein [Bacillaceae bacterium]